MRIVIIGAGVVGLAAAHELLGAGHEVTIVESGDYGQGPSHGNAALVTGVLSFPVPAPGSIGIAARSVFGGNSAISITPQFSLDYLRFLLRMAWATKKSNFVVGTDAQDILTRMVLDGFAEYQEQGLNFEHHTGGSMHVFTSRQAYEQAVAVFDGFPELKKRIRLLEGASAVHEVDPNLAPDVEYAYFAPDDLQVEPDSVMKALVASIEQAGGKLIQHSPVTSFETSDGVVRAAVTSQGPIEADQFIIAAGVGSRGLAKKLGYSLPLFPGGGYSVDVHFEDDSLKPAASVLTDVSHIAVTPLDWGLRASSGMIIGQPEPSVAPTVIDKLIAQVQEIYPDVPVDDVDPGWAGLRPMSADGVPIIGLVPGQRNAYLATGHAMLGLTYAPSTAKVLRALIEGDAPEDYRAFAPARFGAHA